MYQYFSPDTLELITERDPALTREVLGQYINEEAQLLTEAVRLAGEQDWSALGRVFHKYRASYQMIGLGQLAAILQRGEAACQQKDTALISQAIMQWQQLQQPLKAEVARYLAGMGI